MADYLHCVAQYNIKPYIVTFILVHEAIETFHMTGSKDIRTIGNKHGATQKVMICRSSYQELVIGRADMKN